MLKTSLTSSLENLPALVNMAEEDKRVGKSITSRNDWTIDLFRLNSEILSKFQNFINGLSPIGSI